MRIWIGEEQEGPEKGLSTMFVEARFLTRRKGRRVARYMEAYNPSRLYLGAGKKDVVFVSKDFLSCVYGPQIIMETSRPTPALLRRLGRSVQVVARLDLPAWAQAYNIDPKIDYQNAVRIYTHFTQNSTQGVTDGMYKNDKLIWEG